MDDRQQPDETISSLSDADRAAIIDTLVEEMSTLFHGYSEGDVSFEELTFELFDTLQTLHALVTGNVEVEWVSDEEGDLPPSGSNGAGRRR